MPNKTVIFGPTEGEVGRPKIRTSEPSRLDPDRHDDPWNDINIISGNSGRHVSQRMPNTDPWPSVLRTRFGTLCAEMLLRRILDWRVFKPHQIASLPPLVISDRLKWRLLGLGPRGPAHAPVLFGIQPSWETTKNACFLVLVFQKILK